MKNLDEDDVDSQTQEVVENRDTYDGVHLYCRDIGGVKLLTPKKEVRLAARIKKGEKRAYEDMINANLRLVVKIAKKYRGKGLPFLDLISEGNIGLMEAIKRFDPKKGGKLSTYADYWIRQAMRQALSNQSRTIRLSVDRVGKNFRINRMVSQLLQEFGVEPTDEEIADRMGVPISEVCMWRNTGSSTLSLDQLLGDEGNSGAYHEVTKDANAIDPLKALIDSEKVSHQRLRQLVNDLLDPQEAQIIWLLYDLNDTGVNEEFKDIGRKCGVPTYKVKEIARRALLKLREAISRIEPERITNGSAMVS